MRINLFKWLIIIALFINAPASFAKVSASNQEVGKITLLIGEVQVTGPKRKGTVRLAAGATLYVGDVILTRASGHAHLRFVDGALMSIRPASRLTIQEYNYDTQAAQNSRVSFKLEEGIARSISGHAAKDARENFRMNTPVAAIGVRGTDFTVHTNKDRTRALVTEGGIVLSGLLDAGCSDSWCTQLELRGGSEQLLELDLLSSEPRLMRSSFNEALASNVLNSNLALIEVNALQDSLLAESQLPQLSQSKVSLASNTPVEQPQEQAGKLDKTEKLPEIAANTSTNANTNTNTNANTNANTSTPNKQPTESDTPTQNTVIATAPSVTPNAPSSNASNSNTVASNSSASNSKAPNANTEAKDAKDAKDTKDAKEASELVIAILNTIKNQNNASKPPITPAPKPDVAETVTQPSEPNPNETVSNETDSTGSSVEIVGTGGDKGSNETVIQPSTGTNTTDNGSKPIIADTNTPATDSTTGSGAEVADTNTDPVADAGTAVDTDLDTVADAGTASEESGKENSNELIQPPDLMLGLENLSPDDVAGAPSTALVWGYLNTNADSVPAFVQSGANFEAMTQSYQATQIANGAYALYRRNEQDQTFTPFMPQLQFALNNAAAWLNWQDAREPMQVGDGALFIDFEQGLFTTQLELSHEQTGNLIFKVSGTADANGNFNSNSQGQSVNGLVSFDSKEAAYLFNKTLLEKKGEIDGITLWGIKK